MSNNNITKVGELFIPDEPNPETLGKVNKKNVYKKITDYLWGQWEDILKERLITRAQLQICSKVGLYQKYLKGKISWEDLVKLIIKKVYQTPTVKWEDTNLIDLW